VNLEEVVIERGALTLSYGDHVATLSGARLRAACRCAECAALARRGTPVVADDDVAVVDLAPVGAYAAQLRFSDGHERGIYPWVYLGALARAGG